jgi:hypothetical protein
MIVLLKARILSHFLWAECEPIGGGAEVAGAGWLAPVLKFRQPSGELQCIKTACVRYAVSVDEGVCLFDCDGSKEFGRLYDYDRSEESACLYDCGRFPHMYEGKLSVFPKKDFV